ncbi:MAG TPA: preprotein translocase subunit SecE [Candidatus Dormibacteraeota bacterium]|nr:preprotein translocase subunit SecE [Candidatus Dormibacteraeota bacterium]
MAISARRRAQADQTPGVIRFLRETFDELRKVVWPTPQELYRYTLVVVVTVAVIALFIAAVDLGLQQLASHFIYTNGNTG